MEHFRWGENWPIEPDHSRDVASAMAAQRARRRVMIAQSIEIHALEMINEALWEDGVKQITDRRLALQGTNPWGMDK